MTEANFTIFLLTSVLFALVFHNYSWSWHIWNADIIHHERKKMCV